MQVEGRPEQPCVRRELGVQVRVAEQDLVRVFAVGEGGVRLLTGVIGRALEVLLGDDDLGFLGGQRCSGDQYGRHR